MAEEKPEVPGAVEDAIEKTSVEFRAAIARGDFDAANAAAHAGWDLIPDPKDRWDYYPEVLPRGYADAFVRAGNTEFAKEWLTIAMGSNPAEIGQNVPLDRVAARVFAAVGERETAERIAGTLLNMFGERPFMGDDTDLRAYAYAYQTQGTKGARSTTKNVEPEWELPMADGGSPSAGTDLDDEVERLAESGSQLADDEDWDGAIRTWAEALEIIPAPRSEWSASTWLYTSIGDACYMADELDEALLAFGEALKCPDGTDSGFLWFRLGQALADSGDLDAGGRALVAAYILEGAEMFEDSDPKYLELVAGHIDLDDAAGR